MNVHGKLEHEYDLQNEIDTDSQENGDKVSIDNLAEEWLPPRIRRAIDRVEFKLECRLNDSNLLISFEERKLNISSKLNIGALFFIILGVVPFVIGYL